jgi:hypothetical protein
MERHRPECRRHSRAPFIITRAGATGGSPRRNIGGVNFVSLSRSLAYRGLLGMAREADVIRASFTISGETAGAHDQCEGGRDEQFLHLLYP